MGRRQLLGTAAAVAAVSLVTYSRPWGFCFSVRTPLVRGHGLRLQIDSVRKVRWPA